MCVVFKAQFVNESCLTSLHAGNADALAAVAGYWGPPQWSSANYQGNRRDAVLEGPSQGPLCHRDIRNGFAESL